MDQSALRLIFKGAIYLNDNFALFRHLLERYPDYIHSDTVWEVESLILLLTPIQRITDYSYKCSLLSLTKHFIQISAISEIPEHYIPYGTKDYWEHLVKHGEKLPVEDENLEHVDNNPDYLVFCFTKGFITRETFLKFGIDCVKPSIIASILKVEDRREIAGPLRRYIMVYGFPGYNCVDHEFLRVPIGTGRPKMGEIEYRLREKNLFAGATSDISIRRQSIEDTAIWIMLKCEEFGHEVSNVKLFLLLTKANFGGLPVELIEKITSMATGCSRVHSVLLRFYS